MRPHHHPPPPPPPPPLKHIDCLVKYIEVVIYQYKNSEGVVIYRHTKNNLWINTSKRKFIDGEHENVFIFTPV